MTNKLYLTKRKLLYKELQPLFEALTSVRYAVIKGEVLSQQIYGMPDQRRSNDIDILIDKKNVKYLEYQLKKLGFEQKVPEDSTEIRRNRVLCMAYSHQIPSYHKEKFGFHFNVDVNYDIFWGEYDGMRCSIDEFLSSTVDVEVYGVAVKALPLEKAFMQLVLHHYKEMNSLYHLSQHNCIRTYMFRDIYDMLRNNSELLSVECVQKLCSTYLVGKYIYYMIYYADYLFDKFLERYLSELIQYKDLVLLDSFGLEPNERKKWPIPFGQRIDNDALWDEISAQMLEQDLEKIKINTAIFT